MQTHLTLVHGLIFNLYFSSTRHFKTSQYLALEPSTICYREVESMNANLPSEETIEMYRRISKQLTASRLLSRLGKQFDGKPSLPQLLAWVHTKVKFNKGNIIRHNDPFEIIDYGQGKCREFSVLFTAVCLATGYRARIILDMSDHVWTEIWDTKKNKWIHVDPSEKKIDDPEMYERDWKKSLTEVYALENGRIENVTKSYKITEQC